MKPLATTRLRCLKVFIWKDERAVTRADGTRKKTTYAFFRQSPLELHFSLKHLDSALWAHELTHYLVYECTRRGWRLGIGDPKWEERLARIAERVTRQFWKWFDKQKLTSEK